MNDFVTKIVTLVGELEISHKKQERVDFVLYIAKLRV